MNPPKLISPCSTMLGSCSCAEISYTSLQRSGSMGSTTWEGRIMPSALNVNVQVNDDTLVLTDRAGKTITFSKEQTVQKKVSMIALGELCGLPKRHLATG